MQELLNIEPMASIQAGPSAGTKYVTGASVGPKLTSADYHGAELQVVRSNCTGRVGLRGIVLKDTKFTFEIVTCDNEIKTIPKKHTVFRFEVPRVDLGSLPEIPDDGAIIPGIPAQVDDPNPFVFELHGTHFELRAVDRATKKFKPRRLEEL